MAFTQVAVTGTFATSDGDPARGRLRFTPSEAMANDGVVVVAAPVTVTLDSAGELTVTLAATTDPGTTPGDVTYLVEELLVGQRPHAYRVALAHGALTQALVDIAAAASVGTGTWTYTGTAAGRKAPKGAGTGTWVFTGAGVGVQSWTGAGTGAWAFTAAAAGKKAPQGTAAGADTYLAGYTENYSAAGGWHFAGAAVGIRPTVDAKAGTGTGTWTFVGAATGKKPAKGTGSGAWTYVGAGVGFRPAVMVDATSQTFTDTGGLGGQYHIYGAGLPGNGAGAVIHLHGDGAYEHDNPTDNYGLAGNRGLVAVAKAKGYVLVSAKAPDTTGTVTWWEAGARNATWLAELLDSLVTTYKLNRSKIWLSSYSGGAQQVTQYFVPTYGKAKILGGGALILGGGAAPVATPTGWDSTFKAAFPMHWVTGAQDDGTYADDGYDALADATAGRGSYNTAAFTTTLTTPAGIGHEIDGAFGALLDDRLPTLPGYSPPSRTPGSTRPTLVTSYLVTGTGTGTTATPSFTPSAGEVIVVKAWDADFGSPNIASVVGGGLTYATKVHIQATNKAEAWIFVGEVGASSPGSMTVSVTWFGTAGAHGIIVERWSSGLVAGIPAQGATVMGTGAPSSSLTPTNANSVLTWINVDWNVTAGTATYRSSATQTQASSVATVRAYAAYQNTPSTAAQTIGLSAPAGQEWSMGGIELLPAP